MVGRTSRGMMGRANSKHRYVIKLKSMMLKEEMLPAIPSHMVRKYQREFQRLVLMIKIFITLRLFLLQVEAHLSCVVIARHVVRSVRMASRLPEVCREAPVVNVGGEIILKKKVRCDVRS